ncbi:nitroreductase family protein [Paenibacillus eucommiae]|uniref:Nitroreductase n=1 Tax=Paenibacillus eucommiae TaxID=1355755 RepID=A0ABS4INR6_9BACL|nr:nitroreductase family protein [Paenibacillus eucommiae]MBP1989198.1 nitroreductase [Paenibacillus eucommiae]
MSLRTLIRERRSIRKFNDEPVSQEVVMNLLQKADQLCAYNGDVRWRYLYAGTFEERERLADCISAKILGNSLAKIALGTVINRLRKWIIKVPANLITIVKTDLDPVKHDEAYGTLCRILQSFQLLAWEQRLGMVWITSEPIIQNDVFYNQIGLQEDERFVGLLQIGYFDKAPKGSERTSAEYFLTEFATK